MKEIFELFVQMFPKLNSVKEQTQTTPTKKPQRLEIITERLTAGFYEVETNKKETHFVHISPWMGKMSRLHFGTTLKDSWMVCTSGFNHTWFCVVS